MHRRQSRKVSQGDSYAVLVRRRTVNTYCRALPRQVAEKHHFLTPDTPVVDTMELPSRILRDSTTTTTSSSCRSRPISRSDDPNKTPSQPAPSCNMDTVSMEMTCSTAIRTTVRTTTTKSINDKLSFLKETLAQELSKMSHNCPTDTAHELSTATPLSASLAAQPEGKRMEEKDKENEGRGKEGGEQNEVGNQGSMELDSVHLMSCESSGDKSVSSVDTLVTESNKPTSPEREIGNDCRGNGEEGGSGSDIEVPRGVDEGLGSCFSPQIEPLHISPDLPEGSAGRLRVKRKKRKYSVDLQGLVGVSSPSGGSVLVASGPTDGRRSEGSSGSVSVGSAEKKRSRESSQTEAATAAGSGKGKMASASLAIKRKTKRRKRQEKSTSTAPVSKTRGVEPWTTAAVAGGQKTNNRDKVGGRRRGREGGMVCSVTPDPVMISPSLHKSSKETSSLEQHFNALQITPILPLSSHSLHITKLPPPPLTSTPIQQPPAPQDHHRNHRYPLTSTPVLPSGHAPKPLPDNLSEIQLESETRRENPLGKRTLPPSTATNNTGSSSSGMSSTTERLMDFEMMPYQASTVLDLSSLFPQPTSIPPTTTTNTPAVSKTIISRAWKKGFKNTRRSTTSSKKKLSSPSGATGRTKTGAKATNTRPKATKKAIKRRQQPRKNSGDKTTQLSANTNQTATSSVGQKTTPCQANTPEKTTNQCPAAQADKAEPAPKTATKRPRRRCIIPMALRRKRHIRTPHGCRKSLTPNRRSSSTLTPRSYPECLLVCHQVPTQRGAKVLTLSPRYTVCRSPNHVEDILTRPPIHV